jgi:hypothetical protein
MTPWSCEPIPIAQPAAMSPTASIVATAMRNGRSVTAARSTTVTDRGAVGSRSRGARIVGTLSLGRRSLRRGRGRCWIPTSTRGGPSSGGRPIVSAVDTRVAPLLLVTPPTANAQLLHEPREGIQHTSHTKSWQLGQNTNRLRSAVAGRRPQRSQVRRDAEAGTALGERSRRVWHPPPAPTMLGSWRPGIGLCRPVPAAGQSPVDGGPSSAAAAFTASITVATSASLTAGWTGTEMISSVRRSVTGSSVPST